MSWHVGCSFSRRVTCLLALSGKMEMENVLGERSGAVPVLLLPIFTQPAALCCYPNLDDAPGTSWFLKTGAVALLLPSGIVSLQPLHPSFASPVSAGVLHSLTEEGAGFVWGPQFLEGMVGS